MLFGGVCMPFSGVKRKARRLGRRFHSWAKVAELTLSGNRVERVSNLKNTNRPVMLIYGFGATRRTLSIIERRLQKDGYHIFSLNLGGILGTFNTESIEDLGRLIEEKVEAMYKKYNFRGRLTIIGHSKGGLIGHYYIKMLSGDKRVKKLITLGTPHNGNPWALLASMTPAALLLKSVRQMSPTSKLIKALKDKPFPKALRVFSIYSKADTVCPYPVSVLDPANNVTNVEIPNVSHSELLIKKSVYYAVRHALRDEMPTSWEKAAEKDYKDLKEKKETKRFKLIKK